MNTYSIIEIETGNVIQSNLSYEECVNWLDNYGNILDYTTIQDN